MRPPTQILNIDTVKTHPSDHRARRKDRHVWWFANHRYGSVRFFSTPGSFVRIGGEYANFNTQYVDGQHAINHRFQLSGFLIF